jgi:putative transposase
VVRLFIIDGAKALSKAIRRTFGKNTPIQSCQVHKARTIAERLPKEAQVRKALRQAWEMEEGPTADPEPGAAAGQGVAWHRRHHPGGTG